MSGKVESSIIKFEESIYCLHCDNYTTHDCEDSDAHLKTKCQGCGSIVLQK